MKILSAFAGLFLLAGSAPGQLAWEEQRIETTVLPGEEEVSAVFRFRNPTEEPIQLLRVKADCNCTKVEYPKEAVAPGAEGEVRVVFEIGSRTGKNIVRTQILEGGKPMRQTKLYFEVEVESVLTLEPAGGRLAWQVGAAPDAQQIRLTAREGVPLQLEKLRSTNPHFDVALREGEAPGVWFVVVTPKETSEPAHGIIFVHSNYPPRHPRTYYLQARISPQ